MMGSGQRKVAGVAMGDDLAMHRAIFAKVQAAARSAVAAIAALLLLPAACPSLLSVMSGWTAVVSCASRGA